MDERKVIVVPRAQSGRVLRELRLPHPRSGVPASYYADTENEVLLEVATIDMNGRRSWLGDGWVSSDGSLSVMTPTDPLFIYLGLFTTISQGGDEWKYVDVDSLRLETNDTMDALSIGALLDMSGVRRRALHALCDVRDISGDTVARIEPAKVVAWLRRKCDPGRLPTVLGSVGGGLAAQREMAVLVSEYLSGFWVARLFDEFGGFAGLLENDVLVRRVQAVVFDAPESYALGVATPGSGSKMPMKEKPKTAKEKQLEKAALKAKSITSFFKKKDPSS
ncbi:hypothetical protein IWW39_005442 [Coemansia spiralis]|uniref:Rnh202 triple barrel domain-containing protein n=1 Tax=Coemansia spiralis TaxID=417178 RepID=A0A9W8GFE5_9FUNG|nr:hypothetical protein IWW39_005442 [Coemansia spiralis]